jgi:two-component system response regulator
LSQQTQLHDTASERYRPMEILLVEDNLDDIAIAERAFARSGVVSHLSIARDGQEAVDMLFNRAPQIARPDLVLLDVNLPKRNGLAVLAAVRQQDDLATLPVVMLTASARQEDVISSYQLGANTYIQKPVVFERLTRALEVLGQYWFEVATLPPA